MGNKIKDCAECKHPKGAHKTVDIDEEWVPSANEVIEHITYGRCEVADCDCNQFRGE